MNTIKTVGVRMRWHAVLTREMVGKDLINKCSFQFFTGKCTPVCVCESQEKKHGDDVTHVHISKMTNIMTKK